MELPENRTITIFALRSQIAFAISSQGEVYTWGALSPTTEDETPFFLRNLLFLQSPPRSFTALSNIRISSLSCNNSVAMFLSEDGTVYSYGSDATHKYGILGLGEIYAQASPYPVGALLDHRIKHVSVGYSHACAVNSGGCLFTWGSGKKGQLGLKGVERRTLPSVVEGTRAYHCLLATCSYNYTAVLTGTSSCV